MAAPAVFCGTPDTYNNYMANGVGQGNYFGPGVGYSTPSGAFGDYWNAGDYFRRYVPREQWGIFGNGTGHLGQGYGPYIFSPRDGPPPPGLNDPLPGTFAGPPVPKFKASRGQLYVTLPGNLEGVRQVSATIVAFNGAELCTVCVQQPPWTLHLPILDGSKTVRVRVDYADNGLSATSYPL